MLNLPNLLHGKIGNIKMKKLVSTAAAAMMAMSLNYSAHAATVLTLSSPASDGSISGSFNNNNLAAGAFTDTFSFMLPFSGLAAATISSIFNTNQNNNLNFTSVTLNGTEFNTILTGGTEFRSLSNQSFSAGLQTLIVSGISGGNSSYAGTLAVTPSVPEPATWAMMLIGFGLVGFAMRKRSNVRTTVSYA
jgi:hypothetical protein